MKTPFRAIVVGLLTGAFLTGCAHPLHVVEAPSRWPLIAVGAFALCRGLRVAAWFVFDSGNPPR